MIDEHPDPTVRWLLDRVGELENALAHERDWSVKLVAVARGGNVCEHLGHSYSLPPKMARDRVTDRKWRIEKRCVTCGEVTGEWQAEEWMPPKVLAKRRARVAA